MVRADRFEKNQKPAERSPSAAPFRSMSLAMLLRMRDEERISDCMKIRSPYNPRRMEEQPSIPKKTAGRNGEITRARKPNMVTVDQDEICRAVNP